MLSTAYFGANCIQHVYLAMPFSGAFFIHISSCLPIKKEKLSSNVSFLNYTCLSCFDGKFLFERLESPSIKLLGIMMIISIGILLTGMYGLHLIDFI